MQEAAIEIGSHVAKEGLKRLASSYISGKSKYFKGEDMGTEVANAEGLFTQTGHEEWEAEIMASVQTPITASGDFTQYVSVGTDLIKSQTGNTPFDAFQKYKVKSFDLMIHNISFGNAWAGRRFLYNVWLAPWRMPSHNAAATSGDVRPQNLPGTQWMCMNAPTFDLPASQGGLSSVGTAAILQVHVNEPVYYLAGYNETGVPDSTPMMNQYVPTYTRLGQASPRWQGAI
jgi:hypothetical protein